MRLAVRVALATALATAACSPFVVPPYPPAPPGVTGALLSRADVESDVDTLLFVDDAVHPDLYATLSRDSLAVLRRRLLAGLPDTIPRLDAWRRMAWLTAQLGDGHTTLGPPSDELVAAVAHGERFVPIAIAVMDDGSLRVTSAVGTSAVHRGDTIEDVNGIRADSLLARLTSTVSGEQAAWRRYVVGRDVAGYLWYAGIRAPFSLSVRDSVTHETHAVALAGLPLDSIRAARAARTPTAHANFTYSRRGQGVGYLDFHAMGGSPRDFAAEMDTLFAGLARDSIRTLLVDLRRNSGGSSELGEILLAHLTDRPYRMVARKEWKMSERYRAFLRSRIRPSLRLLHPEWFVPAARRLLDGPPGRVVVDSEPVTAHEVRDPRFHGRTCLVTGPGTFSSAVLLADAVATFHLATLLGAETGGVPNAFGEQYAFRLPRTGFLAGVSSARFVRASGDSTDRGGVMPTVQLPAAGPGDRGTSDPVDAIARACACSATPEPR